MTETVRVPKGGADAARDAWAEAVVWRLCSHVTGHIEIVIVRE